MDAYHSSHRNSRDPQHNSSDECSRTNSPRRLPSSIHSGPYPDSASHPSEADAHLLKRSDSYTQSRPNESRFPLDPHLRDHLEQRPSDSPPPQQMPHRVDSMSSTHRRAPGPYDAYRDRPTPPPIATLSHSPSLSLSDRSQVSSPAPGRRTPPHPSSHSYSASSYYSQHQPPLPPSNHGSAAARDNHRSYSYSSSYDHRRDYHDSPQPNSYSNPATYSPPHPTVPSMTHASVPPAYLHPGHNSHPIIYTDDAATKLSDRTRRRCFNCRTTDTSTWRRSNLHPGKVLCNKCGLFERTHSRPRPEQFPHRRGPLASSSLTARTPPSTTLPPISSSVHSLPPYHYHHPSIAPLASVPDSRRPYHTNPLPEIQSWHDPPSTSSSATPPTARRDSRAESS